MVAKGKKFCQHCGKKVNPKAEICLKCGVRLRKPPRAKGARVMKKTTVTPTAPKTTAAKKRNISGPKNAGLALILSFLFPGLGQIYNGQIGRGITFIIIMVILGSAPFVMSIFFWVFFVFLFWIILPIIYIIAFAIWIYNVYDAYTSANKINAGEM